ncbi:MAG TPA: TetR/AcrR family transcriptional regulator [Steroidobacteraceae bacterium]|nr:TetR/AcrR family transcriptional regulator [Steroidobacteraceae bacterium]
MLDTPTATSGRRARPLSPEARRAALVRATLPLVRARGLDVSTREIAAAAGVAEGTIFRAFPDKESLIQAAVSAAFDPAPIVAALEHIDRRAPLRERLTAIVRIVQPWLTTVIHLMMASQRLRPGDPRLARRARPSSAIGQTIARLIEPDRRTLRVSPVEAARLVRMLLFSGSHPGIAEGRPLAPEEIVGVILDGIRTREPSGSKGRSPC